MTTPTTPPTPVRPSEVVPSEWVFVGGFYLGRSEDAETWYQDQYALLDEYLSPRGVEASTEWLATTSTRGLGRCELCGAHFLHGGLFHHLATDRYMTVGRECAESTMAVGWNAKVAKAAYERGQKRRAAEKWAAEHPEVMADLFTAALGGELVARDMWHQLWRKASLSEKQVAFAKTLAERALKAALEAAAAEVEFVAPLPDALLEGRVEVTGVVLGTKWVESQWGMQEKMLVKDDRGFKLWGTAPSVPYGEPEAEKGARVSFMARLERSRDDEFFGFFSRPTRLKVLTPSDQDGMLTAKEAM